jgi:hypothetical protein
VAIDWTSWLAGNTERRLRPRRAGCANLRLVRWEGGLAVAKDYLDAPAWNRATLGRLLISREARIYRRLAGCPGIPRVLARPLPALLVLEYIDGRDLRHLASSDLSEGVIGQLEAILAAMHRRRVVHLDLGHDHTGDLGRETNLVWTANERLFVVDLAGALVWRWPVAGSIFRQLALHDRLAVVKVKRRFFPSLVGPDDEAVVRAIRDDRAKLALAIAVYIAVWSFLCIRRVQSGALGDPDYGLFEQGFYTTLKFGTPFVNTFEAHSSFGNHVTPNFYVLLPFYALYPSVETLVVIQSSLLGLAAWPLFLIARPRLCSGRAGCGALVSAVSPAARGQLRPVQSQQHGGSSIHGRPVFLPRAPLAVVLDRHRVCGDGERGRADRAGVLGRVYDRLGGPIARPPARGARRRHADRRHRVARDVPVRDHAAFPRRRSLSLFCGAISAPG